MSTIYHKENKKIFTFLSSYINEHPEQLVGDNSCESCGEDAMSMCSTPIEVELWDYDIIDVVSVVGGSNNLLLKLLIEAEIDMYNYGRDYQVEGKSIKQHYHLEVCLDFDESTLKYKSITICK